MRVRLPLGRGLFFLCAFLIALAALLPLRLALSWLDLDGSGLSARRAAGSIWFGVLRGARVAGAPVGDLSARLDPLPLVTGRARVDFRRLGGGDVADTLQGAASVTRHSFGIDDVTATLPLGQALAPLPIGGLDLSDVSARFRDGLCERAEGLVRARLTGDIAGVSLPGGLSGNARCEGGALMLPMVSQGGGEMLAVSLSQGGQFRAELTMRPGDDAARARLLAAGFAPAGDGLRLAIQGTL